MDHLGREIVLKCMLGENYESANGLGCKRCNVHVALRFSDANRIKENNVS